MKRKTKNIIMIISCIIILGLFVFTSYYAKNNITSTNEMPEMMSNNMVQQDNASSDNFVNENNQNNTDSTNMPEKPDGDNSNMTPPDKPDGDNSNADNNMQNNSGNNMTPPEKPDGDNNSFGNENMNNSNMNIPNMGGFNKVKLTTMYYVIYGILSFILSSLIIYLIISKFNKKCFKDIFKVSDKLIIFILSLIISTGVITFLSTYIVNNYVLNNSNIMNSNNNMNNTSSNVSYSSSNTISEDSKVSNMTYESTDGSTNALLVSGDVDVTVSDSTITKSGDTEGDDSSFYGNNSAIIAKDGANLTLKNITVNTNGKGANGVFSYGGSATTNNTNNDGTTINISDSKIITTGDSSGGIMTTGGGITNASNLTIETSGTSSAAIRSDRGGGTVNVDGGSYTTNGIGSPSIYSTASVTVKNASLVSKASEGVIIEGKNSISLENCTLVDTNTKLNGQSTTYKNIFLYQSMSGDAASGNALFSSKNSTITTNNGDSFYVTNTSATITLNNNTIINNDSNGNFLRIKKDSWGNEGSNGGNVTLNLNKQNVSGNIVVDSISTLNMIMKSSSNYSGIINGDNTSKNVSLTIDKTSTLTLLGDCYVNSFTDADSSYSNVNFNGFKLYVNGSAIN